MITIKVHSTLDITEADIEKKILTLNTAIHETGFMVKDAVQEDISSYPSVDGGAFMQKIDVDTSVPFQSTVASLVKYAIFLEEGTSAHFISPVTKKALRWKEGGMWFFSKGHMVSGIKPRKHFERTALKMTPVIQEYIDAKLKATD